MVDVYCDLRLEIEPFFLDHFQREVVLSLNEPSELLRKLQKPLNLKSMLAYVRKLEHMTSFNRDAA